MARKTPEPLRFIVGENGRRSGLAVAGTADVEVRILVLPKIWGSKQSDPGDADRRTIRCEPLQGRVGVAVSIVCFEKDTICLKLPGESEADIDGDLLRRWDGVRACLESIAGKAEAAARGRRAALIRQYAASCKYSLTADGLTATVSSQRESEARGDFRTQWQALLMLRQRALSYRTQARIDKHLFSDLADISALESTESLLSPLVRSSFVHLVEELILHVRPGYFRVTQPSRSIRGRMDLVTAAMAMKGGRDTVVCTFDTFGLDTPLLRVIAAALREVAAGDPPGAVPTHPQVIDGAHWLLAKFEAVQPIPRLHASRLGHALLPNLARLDDDWREALRLACMVLDDTAQEPLADTAQGHFGWQGADVASVIFDLNTATLWERIVHKAWPGTRKVLRKHAWKPRKPKRPRGGMKADIVATNKTGAGEHGETQTQEVVADVKYANYEDVRTSAVERQIFAYSHLYEGTERTFVVYVSDDDDSDGESLVRQPHTGSRVTCKFFGLPFPSPCDVARDAYWTEYRQKICGVIEKKIKDD